MTEKLTTLQFDEIRERAEVASGNVLDNSEVLIARYRLALEDIPALLAEVERLRSYISRIPVNCIFCGDTYQADFEREAGLYNCEGCDGDGE